MEHDDANTGGPAAQGARIGEAVGGAVGAAVGEVATRASGTATALSEGWSEGYGQVRGRLADTDTGALVRQWTDVLEGVVEDGRTRAAGLLAPAAPPRRRWPWSVGAAVAGAAAGAAAVLLVRRVVGQDAPDAQEPEQLRAVVDSGPPPPAQ